MKTKSQTKRKKLWLRLCLFFCTLCLISCESELDKYYKLPADSKGNVKQVLKERGNFTIFLRAIERVELDAEAIKGVNPKLLEGDIITAVTPSDPVFSTWLTNNGYGSVEDIPMKELRVLVFSHLIRYSYSRDMLANYTPEGREAAESQEKSGVFNRFWTMVNPWVYEYNSESIDDFTAAPSDEATPTIRIGHYDSYLPVFSSYFFRYYGLNAKLNYEYFFPNSTWGGDEQEGGFNIANAHVSEYGVPADNGYIYVVDQVIEPLRTIHAHLKEASDFSTFISLYDRFSDFTLDQSFTDTKMSPTPLYMHNHVDLLNIASEKTYNNTLTELDAILAASHFNIFAPSNEALSRFFDDYWKDYYESIEQVNFLPLHYLLSNHYTPTVVPVFPEYLTRYIVSTNFDTRIDFDADNAILKKICSNGVLYGLNDVMVPQLFEGITAPLVRDPSLNAMLYVSDLSGRMPSLMMDDPNMRLTLFAPVDELLLEGRTTIGSNNSPIYFRPGNINKFKDEGEGLWMDGVGIADTRLSINWAASIISNHVGTLIAQFGNNKIYKTLNSYQYLLFDTENNKVYSSLSYNQSAQDNMKQPGEILSKYTGYNGETYTIGGDNSTALMPDAATFKNEATSVVPIDDYVEYKTLVTDAGLSSTVPKFSFLQSRFIALVPTKEAIIQAKADGRIPTGRAALQNFLRYHFINVNASALGDYFFPGYDSRLQTGLEVETYRTIAGTTPAEIAQLTIIDAGGKIQIRDKKGNTVNVVHVFPYIYDDGAAYMIDGILELE